MSMNQSTQMDLFPTKTKKPLGEAPRHTKGTNRGKLNQRALQVEGEVTQCNPHPIYEGLFYWAKSPKGFQQWFTEDYWINIGKKPPSEVLAKRRAAVEYNRTKPAHEPPVLEDGHKVGNINQDALQVTWKPASGSAHPVYVNYRYWGINRGKQSWISLEAFEKQREKDKEWRASPEGRAKAVEYSKRHIENSTKQAAKRRSIFQRAYDEYKEGIINKEEYEKVCALGKGQVILNTGLSRKDKWHLDHIIPETHGGLTTVQNLQLVSASWNISKRDRNRHVNALHGPDYDVWYHTPYAFPKCRQWTLSLSDKEITKLTFVPNPRDS
jgi:hypothetical protein